jgi:hypothetical protein
MVSPPRAVADFSILPACNVPFVPRLYQQLCCASFPGPHQLQRHVNKHHVDGSSWVQFKCRSFSIDYVDILRSVDILSPPFHQSLQARFSPLNFFIRCDDWPSDAIEFVNRIAILASTCMPASLSCDCNTSTSTKG